jgi:hypothetical protein
MNPCDDAGPFEVPVMYVFSWLVSIVVALVATCTIAFALPVSPSDELVRATAPQSVLASGNDHVDSVIASCFGEAE